MRMYVSHARQPGFAFLLLALGLAAGFCRVPVTFGAEDGWVWKRPEIKAVQVKKEAPKIDGDLSDECWKDAAVSKEFQISDGRKAKGTTTLRVLRDDTTLYLAVDCQETPENLKKLETKASTHDADEVWADDCVELFIDPTNKRASYYQIIVNAKGTTWDAWHESPAAPDKSWEPKYAVATKVNANGWTLEIALPLAIFNKDKGASSDGTWSLNASRMRKAAGEVAYWSPVYNDSSHTPETMGDLHDMPGKK